jgi:plastocyanin
MLDTLDSRALRRTDCYGQRFMKTGTFRYHVLPIHGHNVTDDVPFSVQVVEPAKKPQQMKQHTVRVRAERGKFRVDQADLVIEAGDMVVWNCPDAAPTAYLVAGDKEFFASQRLVNECGYSHAFAAAGEYRWVDAFGSALAGVVRVQDPVCRNDAEFQRWHQLLSKGTVVMIDTGKAQPQEVEIVTGQTIFFAVVKGPGISITDERLLVRQDGKDTAPKGNSAPGRPKRT